MLFAVPPGHHPDGGLAPNRCVGSRNKPVNDCRWFFPRRDRETWCFLHQYGKRSRTRPGLKPAPAETGAWSGNPTCPPPGTGLATRNRGAPRTVRCSRVSVPLAGGGRETRNSPPIRKKNRLATAGMDMKQSRTETRRRLVSTPSNPERGPGWPPLNKVASRQDSRIWWRWVLSRWNGESRSSLSPKKARENAQNKPVMVAYLDLAIITKV
jgi:hypothetical protein